MQEELGALRGLTWGSEDCGSAQEGVLKDGFGIGQDLKPRQICWQGFLSGRQKRTGERALFGHSLVHWRQKVSLLVMQRDLRSPGRKALVPALTQGLRALVWASSRCVCILSPSDPPGCVLGQRQHQGDCDS